MASSFLAHRQRQLARERKNGAGFSKTAIDKRCGFRTFFPGIFFPRPRSGSGYSNASRIAC
jgi:hypothetical protein